MAGQPTPPTLVEAFAINAPDCTPAAPIAGGKTFPFPVPSQISVQDGTASLNDGFVPLNMTDPTSGGIPPFGIDMNGILYAISAPVAYLMAGQLPLYDAVLQTAMGGYALGARIRQAANANAIWVSTVNGNVTNPDTGGAGWLSSVALYVLEGTTTGTYANFVLPGPSDYALDFDATTGNINLNGFVAQRDGQRVTICKIDASANIVTVAAGVGTAANQVRAVGDYALGQQYADVTIQYNSTLGRWLVV